MVLADGRVGFIDFGIVGRIRPETWSAVRDFVSAIMMGNFDGMAEALSRIGVTQSNVNIKALSEDLRILYQQLDGSPSSHQEQLNPVRTDDDVNELLIDIVRVGENHGLHFPREFALLLKQFLYFDRYVHILAPEMDMFMDERLKLMH